MLSTSSFIKNYLLFVCVWLLSCTYEPVYSLDAGTSKTDAPMIMSVAASPITGGTSTISINGANLLGAKVLINDTLFTAQNFKTNDAVSIVLDVTDKVLNADSVVGVAGIAAVYAINNNLSSAIKKFNFYYTTTGLNIKSSDMPARNETGVSGRIDSGDGLGSIAIGLDKNHVFATGNIPSLPTQDIFVNHPVTWAVLADMDNDRMADLVLCYAVPGAGQSFRISVRVYRNIAGDGMNKYFNDTNFYEFDTGLTTPGNAFNAIVVVSDVDRNGTADITATWQNSTQSATKTFYR